MATVNQDEENQQPTTGGTSAAGTGAGVAGANSAPKAPTSNVQQNVAPQQNQGYTDVASYLNANQQGGNQLGSQVASNLSNQYNTTKQGIDTSAGSANKAVQSGYIPENTQLIQQVASNPTAAAGDSNLSSQFQGQLNDTYGGPTSWADYGTQQGNVNQATQNAGLLGKPGGNNVLIQQVENQTQPGHISQGINALDTMLFSGNQGAVNQAKQAAAPINTLNDYLNAANTGVLGNISAGQQGAQQASQDALNAFTGANGTLTNLNSAVTNNTSKALSDAQAQQAQLKADLTSGQLTPQDLVALGMGQNDWTALQNNLARANTSQYMTGHNFGAASATQKIDPLQALQQQDPTAMINAGTVATPEQYQQMAAIQQLLGSKTPQGLAINPLNASQAGTYNPANLNQFDFGGLNTYAQNVGDQERAAAQAQADQLTAAADAKHNASKGGFLSKLPTFAKTGLSYLANPLTAVPQEYNPVQSFKDNTKMAHGGEVKDINEYLNKVK